jgi:UDP-N-acetylglucosamine:LPS N-acetylglucosamine transferase
LLGDASRMEEMRKAAAEMARPNAAADIAEDALRLLH